MQEISRFSGVVVLVNGSEEDDVSNPKIEVYYGDYHAILTGEGLLINGFLPYDLLMIMTGWLKFYREDINRNWRLELNGDYVTKTPQLKRSKVTIKEDVYTDGDVITEAKPLDFGMILVTFSNGKERIFDTVALEEKQYISLREPGVIQSVCIDEDGSLSFKDGELVISPETVHNFSFDYKK